MRYKSECVAFDFIYENYKNYKNRKIYKENRDEKQTILNFTTYTIRNIY